MTDNNKNISEQLHTLREEIAQLEKDVSSVEVMKDPKRIKQAAGMLTKKKEELVLYEELESVEKQLVENESLSKTETDADLKALAEEEIASLNERREQLLMNIADAAQSGKGANATACIIEIRAGTGGEESNLFASDLFRMYARYAETNDWSVTILDKNQTGTGGFKEISAQIDGDGCYKNLQYESGVHRVQRIPATESSGRIHTSAASVVVYPLIETEEIKIDPQDIKIDVYRSSGPGGQSVNTTDSAVRITHIPTGLVVSCQDEKSQHKNKKKAMSILQSKLADMQEQEQADEVSDIRKSAIKSGDRSAKIRTYNFPQNRVTDHRIKKSWHNLKDILDGSLDNVVETLAKAA